MAIIQIKKQQLIPMTFNDKENVLRSNTSYQDYFARIDKTSSVTYAQSENSDKPSHASGLSKMVTECYNPKRADTYADLHIRWVYVLLYWVSHEIDKL